MPRGGAYVFKWIKRTLSTVCMMLTGDVYQTAQTWVLRRAVLIIRQIKHTRDREWMEAMYCSHITMATFTQQTIKWGYTGNEKHRDTMMWLVSSQVLSCCLNHLSKRTEQTHPQPPTAGCQGQGSQLLMFTLWKYVWGILYVLVVCL